MKISHMRVEALAGTTVAVLFLVFLTAAQASAPAFQYIHSFGAGNGRQSGPGQLATPEGVAVQRATGDVLVADNMNDRIQEFAPTGKFIRAFGTQGSKTGQFNSPIGLGVNHAGDIYVADNVNARVQEFSSTFKFIRRFGTFSTGPGDLAVAPNGDVYVVDGATIRHYQGNGKYVGSFGGTGGGKGQFHSTIDGLAVGPKGQVWAGDYSGGRVEDFSPTGTYIRSVAYKGNTAVLGPLGVGVTSSAIFVSDNGNGRVIELYLNGTLERTFGVSGKGRLDSTASLALDCRGNVYVSDLDVGRVREYGNPATSKGMC
jgi:hypothetical protein